MTPTAGRLWADARNRSRRRLLHHHGGVAILLYHRVAAVDDDPEQLAVAPERFAAHLRVLWDTCTPVALRDLPRLLRRPLPPRPVVLTFDDGYRDNLHEAKPLLRDAGVPATVFVASGYVGSGREFWWDELDRHLRRTPAAPRDDHVAKDGMVLDVSDAPARERAYATLAQHLRRAPLAERDVWLAQLRAWAGEPPEGVARADRLAVDVDELRALDGDGIEVGAHTTHHLSLAAQPWRVQRDEIARSMERLGAWLDRRVTSLSYPFGTPGADVSRATRLIGRASGARLATMNRTGLVHAASPRLALPRHIVRDWTADRFAAWLDHEVFGR